MDTPLEDEIPRTATTNKDRITDGGEKEKKERRQQEAKEKTLRASTMDRGTHEAVS
jgi:hypothetical protein